MEQADGIVEKIKRIAICLSISSLVFLLMLIVIPERPPINEIFKLWLYSHFGPLSHFPYDWSEGLLTLTLCLLLIIPSVIRRNEYYIALCTSGIFLWLFVGMGVIIKSI